MKKTLLLLLLLPLMACNPSGSTEKKGNKENEFQYVSERFEDKKVLRYTVPGFEDLSLKEKKLLYYLSQAAISGRDIIWDQNYKHNLTIRRTLEAIIQDAKGIDGEEWNAFIDYAKEVWFANGIHHHYSYDKFQPKFSKEFFADLVRMANEENLPLMEGEGPDELLERLTPILFDPSVAAKKVNKATGIDHVKESAVNFYEGVTEEEVKAFYAEMKKGNEVNPVSYGLNSKLVKENGKIVEKVWKIDGMYGAAIQEVVKWLEKAITVAENEKQKTALELLVKYYKSGDLADFDAYNIAWVQDVESNIDVINGFIEVYNDPIGYKGSFESVVSFRDPEASKRIEAISKEAQWFEDNSPLVEEHKKKNVKGVSARVINVVMESGDASPATPIGINLPNSNWIRKDHGSKSVNLANIVSAYDEAAKQGGGFLEEFVHDQEVIENTKKHGELADKLHTDMHEVIGHASGQINPGIGEPKETMKEYASTMEEGRADLVALYYMIDPKLVELGLMESIDVGKAAYDDYLRNGLMTQLTRIKPGDQIEEDHMRNRAMVSYWCLEKGKDDNVVEMKKIDGKTYVVINDYEKLQELFGQLLREVQRIKSEGDYEAAKELVETYGVNVDPELHAEVLERYEKLNSAPYSGFIQPRLVAVEQDGEITDVKLEVPENFKDQMLYYAKKYSFLPNYN
ncbi:MAG: dipeptidyl peptidase 3 [Bacteroidia bacterium]|nr:dipeptidyl peptidase 3 [Bacteroidia bacterium]